MQFTPTWIVTFSLLLLCSLAIIFIAKFTIKPIDEYGTTFRRVFPFEVIKSNEKGGTIYKALLCVFVAASFAPLFNLLTSYGQIANIQGISIAICCIYGLAAICFAFLHYFDATHTLVHIVLFVLFVCLTLLGNLLAAIKGVAVYQVYLKHDENMVCALIGSILCGLTALMGIILSLNPRLKNWANLEKLDYVESGYVRPKTFILAFSEWLSFFFLVIGELSYFLILLVQ